MTRVCVVGAGAIGGLLASALRRSGAEVALLARGATLVAIRRHGLVVDGTAHRLRAEADAAALGPQDYLFLALKAPALVHAAPSLLKLLGGATRIVSAMNGVPWWFFPGGRVEAVDPGGAVSAALPPEKAIGCVVHLSAASPAPGVVRRGKGNRLIVGTPAGAPDEATRTVTALLRDGGFEVELSEKIRQDVWAKLWGNMNINPIAALTLAAADRIHDSPETLDLVRAMMHEHEAIGGRLGLAMGMTIEERIAVTRQLGAFKPSTLQDLEAGKPLETEALLGAVVEIGRNVGVQTPFSSAVLGLLRLRERS